MTHPFKALNLALVSFKPQGTPMDPQEIEILIEIIKGHCKGNLFIECTDEELVEFINQELTNQKKRFIQEKIPFQPNKMASIKEYLLNGQTQDMQKASEERPSNDSSPEKSSPSPDQDKKKDNLGGDSDSGSDGKVRRKLSKPVQKRPRSNKVSS